MNEQEYLVVQQDIERQLAQLATPIMGRLLVEWAIVPKRYLYPALAELLGLECECRLNECKGCDDVEEWLRSLSPEDDE